MLDEVKPGNEVVFLITRSRQKVKQVNLLSLKIELPAAFKQNCNKSLTFGAWPICKVKSKLLVRLS